MKEFMTGCNYWASNAGMLMWRDFDAETVEKDLALLSSFGVDTLRVFPLWSDFQPVENTFTRAPLAYRMHGKPVTRKDVLDENQLKNFAYLLDTAEKYGMRVVVSLLTGWMSGRLFAPSFLLGRNLLTDPEAVLWECGFIKAFVSAFRHRKCIAAWEPGNECNCLDYSVNEEQAELWLMTITDAIRAADNSRPVYAGMHGLTCGGVWNIPVAAQYTDAQTTHPYPLFTPYCQTEELTYMRAALHAAAETIYYASVADQPCLAEEVGTLGPMVIGDEHAPDYLEKAYASSLQYGATGFLWWCAFDQDKLDFPPYDTITVERNLGLVYSDGTPKPLLYKLKELKERFESFGKIPPARKHAVVILTDGDDWAVAYGAFVLAVQAGFTVEFMHASQALKDSAYYILPCITGTNGLPKRLLAALEEKTSAGAKLLITYDGGHIGDFEKLTGLQVLGRRAHAKTFSFALDGMFLSLDTQAHLICAPANAEILCRSEDKVVFSRNAFGQGRVYFLNAPLEKFYTEAISPCETGLHKFYTLFFRDCPRPLILSSHHCAVTYHDLEENRAAVLITNFSDKNIIPFELSDGLRIKTVKGGKADDKTLYFEQNIVYVELIK